MADVTKKSKNKKKEDIETNKDIKIENEQENTEDKIQQIVEKAKEQGAKTYGELAM